MVNDNVNIAGFDRSLIQKELTKREQEKLRGLQDKELKEELRRRKQVEIQRVEQIRIEKEMLERSQRFSKRLNQPIFKKGGVRTGIGKSSKKKVNIGRATRALRQLI